MSGRPAFFCSLEWRPTSLYSTPLYSACSVPDCSAPIVTRFTCFAPSVSFFFQGQRALFAALVLFLLLLSVRRFPLALYATRLNATCERLCRQIERLWGMPPQGREEENKSQEQAAEGMRRTASKSGEHKRAG